MSQEQEGLIIAMMAQGLALKLLDHAKTLQNQAEKTHNVMREALAAMPAEILRGAAAGFRELLQEATGIAVDGLKTSAESLQAAAAEGRASAKFLRRTGIMQGFLLVAAAVLIIGLVHFVAVPALRAYS